MLGISRNFQKARQPFVVQNGVLAESSRIFALAIGSLMVAYGGYMNFQLLWNETCIYTNLEPTE